MTVALAADEVTMPEVALPEPEMDEKLAERELASAEVTALADPLAVTFIDPETETEEDADETTVLVNGDEEGVDAAEDEERIERDGEDKTADVGVPKMEDVNVESELGAALTTAGRTTSNAHNVRWRAIFDYEHAC